MHLNLQRTWLRPTTLEVPDQCPDLQRSWIRSTASEVPDLCLDLQRSQVSASSLGDPRLMARPTEVLAQFLGGPSLTFGSAGVLAQVYSLEGPRFMPRFAEVSGPGPLIQWLLPYTCSCGVYCLRSTPAQVAGSVLLWQSLLPQACSLQIVSELAVSPGQAWLFQ